MKYYLRIEGVNLGNFVYDTQDLSTIRGSGLAVLKAVTIFDGKSIGGIKLHKTSSGASAGLFEFEVAEDTEFEESDFCNAIRDKLKNSEHIFRYATFAIDVLPFTDSSTDNFIIDREKVLAKNRWQQMQMPSFVIPPKNDNELVCEFDLVSPAKDTKERIKGEEKFVSHGIFQRREYGKRQKQSFVKTELKDYKISESIEKEFVYHFDLLTTNVDKGNLKHKMAVIYLDGNKFGSKQRDLDLDKLKKFDKIKIDYQRNFLASLMEEVTKDKDWQISKDGKTHYQVEILLWGGDEICLVVPAWKGWETVELFFEQTKNLKWQDEQLTHSVGMVFCHHNAPIRRIKKLAESLAELAKERSRNHNHLAYEILESFDHISKDLAEHRRSRCPQIEPLDINSMILDGNKMKKMSKSLREIKSFYPRRKLTEIVINLLSDIENEEEKAELKSYVDSLIHSVRGSIGQENVEKLDEYYEPFDDNKYTALINANELWDYIEEAKQ